MAVRLMIDCRKEIDKFKSFSSYSFLQGITREVICIIFYLPPYFEFMKWVSLLLLFVLPILLNAQEKVYFNARIFTADWDHPFAEAIAIKGKWIVAVGNYDDVKRSVNKNAKQIDLGGSFLCQDL
jgi:hypothetical protein